MSKHLHVTKSSVSTCAGLAELNPAQVQLLMKEPIQGPD